MWIAELISLLTVLVAGMALGGAYFSGLLLTVRYLLHVRATRLWLMVSFVLRVALVLGGLCAVMQGSGGRLLAALGGIWVSRNLLMRYQVRDGRVARGSASLAADGGHKPRLAPRDGVQP